MPLRSYLDSCVKNTPQFVRSLREQSTEMWGMYIDGYPTRGRRQLSLARGEQWETKTSQRHSLRKIEKTARPSICSIVKVTARNTATSSRATMGRRPTTLGTKTGTCTSTTRRTSSSERMQQARHRTGAGLFWLVYCVAQSAGNRVWILCFKPSQSGNVGSR